MADNPRETTHPQNVTLSAGPDGIVHVTQPPQGQMSDLYVGYTDAQGDQITDGDDHIVVMPGATYVSVHAGDGDDLIEDLNPNGWAELYGGAGSDTIYTGANGEAAAGGLA